MPAFTSRGDRTFTLIIRDISHRKEVEVEHGHNYQIQATLNQLLLLSFEKPPLEKMLQQSLELIFSFSGLSKDAVFLAEKNALVMKAQKGDTLKTIG